MKRSGLTIVELLVVMGLLGLLLTICGQIVQPSLRVWELNRARADLDQAALVATTRLQRDLLGSHREAVSFRPADPCALAFPLSERYEALTGKPVFDRWVLYSLDPQNRLLYRRQWTVPATTEPEALLDPQLSVLAATPPLKRVAGHVAALRVLHPNGEQGPIRIELDLQRPARGAPEVTFRVLELNPRNSP